MVLARRDNPNPLTSQTHPQSHSECSPARPRLGIYPDRNELVWLYLALEAIADDFFFGCFVEHFTDQGGQYAAVRTDVGEPGVPINNSSFIAVPDITKQFTTPYFRW